MSTSSRTKIWTPEEDAKLELLATHGSTSCTIAKVLDRSQQSVKARMRVLGLTRSADEEIIIKYVKEMRERLGCTERELMTKIAEMQKRGMLENV